MKTCFHNPAMGNETACGKLKQSTGTTWTRQPEHVSCEKCKSTKAFRAASWVDQKIDSPAPDLIEILSYSPDAAGGKLLISGTPLTLSTLLFSIGAYADFDEVIDNCRPSGLTEAKILEVLNELGSVFDVNWANLKKT